MKTIKTLVPDIYSVLEKKDGSFTELLATDASKRISAKLNERLSNVPRKATLRLSGMGPRCPRALWYSIHRPDLAEPLPAWAEFKYTFGDCIESLAIGLSKAAGHSVLGEQDELVLDGIVGHRDCVIDGCVVDVKSCSSFSFKKFKFKTLHQDDSFGYLDQLDGYVLASADDPIVRVKDRGYILAIDKQLGRMVLYEHIIRPDSIRERIRHCKRIVECASPPPCECKIVPHGASGNYKLDTKASYSAFRRCCFPHLRTFVYKEGPVDLAIVKRLPDVPEVNY